ncbi:hypothetical protein NX059_009622 [Plenodomus lindquistii]|nr:hypothetical protein NX059_009622 [Plenodomus lindquistii]
MATKRALAARSIHVRIVPRPANLSESREILRVLRRFGEVSMFKYMKYEYQNPLNNVALAIFRDATSAQAALDASPIRFALERVATNDTSTLRFAGKEQEEEGGEGNGNGNEADDESWQAAAAKDNIDDILRPSQLLAHTLPPSPPTATSSTSTPPMPFSNNQTPTSTYTPPTTARNPHRTQPQTSKPFHLTLDHSRVIHADFIERQPFYKYFHPMKSLAQRDLATQVPHPGLADVSKRPPGAYRTPIRVLGAMREYVDKRMRGLKGIEEGREGWYRGHATRVD